MGKYKGDLIAVKVSEVWEETSWKNENEIYQHLSHENILRKPPHRNPFIQSPQALGKRKNEAFRQTTSSKHLRLTVIPRQSEDRALLARFGKRGE